MPNLYGNPTKDAIRAQKRELLKASLKAEISDAPCDLSARSVKNSRKSSSSLRRKL